MEYNCQQIQQRGINVKYVILPITDSYGYKNLNEGELELKYFKESIYLCDTFYYLIESVTIL